MRTHQTYPRPLLILLAALPLIFATSKYAAALSASAETRPCKRRHVVVVGGGVGGLAISARIASSCSEEDYRVTLLEKNPPSMLGGRCGSFDVEVDRLGTFRHERGPSLLLLKAAYEELFEECSPSGKTAEDYGLAMEQCIPAYQVVFDDGDSINLGFPRNRDKYGPDLGPATAKAAEAISRSKMDSFEENGAAKWDEYMRSTAAFLDCGLPNFIEERLDLRSFPAFLLEALRGWGKAWPLKPHSDVLDATFSSSKMKALASFQDLYVGLEPYGDEKAIFGGVLTKTAPAVFGLLAALELHPTNSKAGVFAPVGGFRAVASAFESLCRECGVNICCDTTVSKVSEGGVYVSTNNGDTRFLEADAIVVNADLPFATQTLLKPPPQPSKGATEVRYDWDDKFDYSSGVIAFHWSTDTRFDDLNTHNVFLAAKSRAAAEESWGMLRCNRRNDSIEGAPFNFYVHRAVKTDPTAAPQSCDSIMVLVPCETLSRREALAGLPRGEAIKKYKEQFDDAYIARIKEEVLKRMGAVESLEDLKSHIVAEVVDTPGSYADFYNLAAGTPFALSHGFAQLSLTRPSPQSKQFDNVFFVGAGTRPGNGVPLVLLGAKAISQKVIQSLRKESDG